MLDENDSAATSSALWRGASGVGGGILLISAVMALSLGCFGSESTRCGDEICQKGFDCDPLHGLCVRPSQLVLCQGEPDGSPCTVDEDDRYVCDQQVCVPMFCGDGVVGPDEACDDGNEDNHDSCLNTCQVAGCGDGVQHLGSEECDGDDLGGGSCTGLGFTGGALVCLADCHVDRTSCVGGCGNGALESGEECDAGSAASDVTPDACRTDCRWAGCGDGVLDSGEECDDGATNSNTAPNACRIDCRVAWCGDGVVDANEECDNGVANSNTAPNACRTDCLLARCGDGVVDTGEQCDDGNTELWDGCGVCAITEFQVNVTINSDQTYPTAAITTDGRFVIAWQTTSDIFARYYSGQGTQPGGELQINMNASDAWGRPAAAMSPTGDFVVVWNGSTNNAVFGRRFDAQATPLGDEFQVNVNTSSNPQLPAVAMADDGRFVVGWRSFGLDGSGFGVHARRFDASGSPLTIDFVVNTTTLGHQSWPAVGVSGDGRFVVAFAGPGATTTDIWAQRYSGAGVSQGGELLVNTYTPSAQQTPAVAAADDGHFVVVWQSQDQDGAGFGIYAQAFTASGATSGMESPVNTYTTDDQEFPAIAMAGDGRFVVVWESGNQDGDREGIYARRFNANGSPAGGEIQVNQCTADDQVNASVAMADDGSFVVTWQSDNQDGSGYGVYAQRFDPQGSALGTGF